MGWNYNAAQTLSKEPKTKRPTKKAPASKTCEGSEFERNAVS